jgi:hypothetical protein
MFDITAEREFNHLGITKAADINWLGDHEWYKLGNEGSLNINTDKYAYPTSFAENIALESKSIDAYVKKQSGTINNSHETIKDELFVVTSSDNNLNDLERALIQSERNTIQISEKTTLTDLIETIKTIAPDQGFKAIHLLGHGSEGAFQIGQDKLTSRNLWRHKNELHMLGSLLAKDGDIMIYGCETGKGATGKNFVDLFAKYTQCDVAASDNITFSSLSSNQSDWQLETQHGKIETKTDILTGLQWQGSLLANQAKLSDATLWVDTAQAKDPISILRKDNSSIVVQGFGNDIIISDSGTISRISFSNSNQDGFGGIRIGDIDLDTLNGNKIYQSYYNIDISLDHGTWSSENARINTNPVELLGNVYTYGGNISINTKGDVTIGSLLTHKNINTYQNKAEKTGMVGDIAIQTSLSAVDAPTIVWVVNNTNQVVIQSETIESKSISIASKATVDPYLGIGNSQAALGNFVDKFVLDSILDTSLYGLQNTIIPATVKVGSASSSITVKDTTMVTQDTISLKPESSISMESICFALDNYNSVSYLTGSKWSAAVAVTIANSNASISIENSSLTGKNITTNTSATNSLSSSSQIANNLGLSSPSGQKVECQQQ